jgi:transcriptional antiterminator
MMVSLDSRSVRILKSLLGSDSVTTTSDIADLLGMSPRMVRYRLDKVENWLTGNGLTLHKESGVGLWVEGEEEKISRCQQDLQYISGYELILTPEQRHQILRFYLLLENTPTVATALEGRLGISRSTLFSDLEQVSDWMQRYEIEMVRKPGFGIQLVGKESQYRQAIVDTIIDHVGQEKLLYALIGGSQNISNHNPAFIPIASSPIVTFLNSLQISHAYKMITRMEENIKVQFSDFSTVLLLLHISIMIVRIAQDKQVESSIAEVNVLTDHPYFPAVLEGLSSLGRELKIPISFSETAYLFSRLLMMETFSASSDTVRFKLDELHILELVTQSLMEVDGLIGNPRLSENSQVVHELARVFEPFLERLSLNSNLQNPLLKEFMATHADLYHAAEIISQNLAERTGREIPPAEVGYIGMCLYSAVKKITSYPKTKILVICTMGAVTSHLLAERLKSEFPELEIIDVMSVRKFLANPILEADAIVSTEAHLPVQTYLPVFHVHPLLTEKDVRQIKIWLLEKETHTKGGGAYQE